MDDSAKPPAAPPAATRGVGAIAFVAVLLVVGGGAFAVARMTAPAPAGPTIEMRPTPSLLVAVRDLARLETTELHFEKVIDLSETQTRVFGLVDATDALLLVAAVDVTMGVDLGKLGEGDVRAGVDGGPARVCLPAPEIFSSRLDEQHTYVYRRTTGLLAKRNEALEARARAEAIADVEKAVRSGDAAARARAQAERQIRALASQLGAGSVEFACP
jgi:hypothetical protein